MAPVRNRHYGAPLGSKQANIRNYSNASVGRATSVSVAKFALINTSEKEYSFKYLYNS